MKGKIRFVIIATAWFGAAHAMPPNMNSVEMSSFAVVSGVGSLVATPIIIVSQIGHAIDGSHKVSLRDAEGRETTVALPQKTVEALQLAPGDELTVEHDATGGLLLKKGKPVAYLVHPDHADLTRQ